MEKRGFTVVELLAVIVLLSLIAIIVYPNISRSIRGAKSDLSSAQIASIKDATQMYVDDNVGNDEFFDSGREEVTLKILVDNGYINGSTYDLLLNKNFDLELSQIIITRSGEYPNYKYEYDLDMH